jgi:hypothetical protein
LSDGLIKEKASATYMTSRAHTHGEYILAGWLQSKGLVEGRYPIDFDDRDAKSPGHGLHSPSGNVAIVGLNVQEHFDQLTRSAATPFQDFVKSQNWHADLLTLGVLNMITMPDTGSVVNTE